MLKTAEGYVIVLQTFDEEGNGLEQCVRLMKMAKEEGDWDLCKELARFLMALDETGDELRKALDKMGISVKHSSPSRTSISGNLDAENEEHVCEESSRSEARESNGAPKGYGAKRLDNDEGVSPKCDVGEDVGQENRSRFEEAGAGQEDYFSYKGEA